MTTPAPRPIEVACPTCGETTLYAASNPFRPFCSARCQGQDFGAWANEAYRVEAPPTTEDQDEAER
ncbi:DNA gyrase inhibitor YacG [Ideonella sp. 4Y16]|uniref:DNA gyrase inhibitor YacG n=1 Tax=Ideonella alba TaxID=2824118 RepID=A0A941BFQ2_9BURK|nr:DNA gyrase inhibitor YacG [Ideonella alba]MBQ0932311.1 DNA gyrase inhibitor YacG [Ideonella alba]MBQ0944461.1 DNA gyrase inhibitor YacG [Ideonella alba]